MRVKGDVNREMYRIGFRLLVLETDFEHRNSRVLSVCLSLSASLSLSLCLFLSVCVCLSLIFVCGVVVLICVCNIARTGC